MSRRTDILMVTYRSSGYVHLSLPRLLDSCGEHDRVWLWHNGDDEATLDALAQYRDDARIAAFHHSRENVRLRQPTNWLWSSSSARYVSKVDDDCLVTPGWLDILAAALEQNPSFGVVGSWRHPEDDFRPEVAHKKIQAFACGHQLLRNLWVQGSGYLLRRRAVEQQGLLRDDESFTGYCLRLSRAGWINGFYYPFVPEEHMDDPRSPHTLVRSDEELHSRLPLSAQANGVRTVADWTAQLQRSALVLQTASLDPAAYAGWRRRWRNASGRARRLVGRPANW